MYLIEYRNRNKEQERVSDLMSLLPEAMKSVLDIGCRDGYISIRLAQFFDSVTALDLQKPQINHDRISCIQGDVTSLNFPDRFFDVILCAEVLEHIPHDRLIEACFELYRVARRYVIVGVPYKQDIRAGRTTCRNCGEKNPPWGHVNTFDENRLKQLFKRMEVETISYVGINDSVTNAISTWLLDLAGNPYGTYGQEEPCVHCGVKLEVPPPRNILQKVFVRLSYYFKKLQKPFIRPNANWIHVVFRKIDDDITNQEKLQ